MFPACTLPETPAYLPEMVMFLARMAELMLDVMIRPYIVTSVCHDMFADTDVTCSSSDGMNDVENDVQNRAARYLIYYRILTTLPAVMTSLVCGAWSDRNGRKIPLTITGIGTVLAVVFYLASLRYANHALSLIMFGAAIQGLFGKRAIIGLAVNSYVSDFTEREKRTPRFGRLVAMNFAGKFLGSLLSGVLQDEVGFGVTLCVATATDALGVMLVVFCLPESVPRQADVADSKTESEMAESENAESEKDSSRVIPAVDYNNVKNKSAIDDFMTDSKAKSKKAKSEKAKPQKDSSTDPGVDYNNANNKSAIDDFMTDSKTDSTNDYNISLKIDSKMEFIIDSRTDSKKDSKCDSHTDSKRLCNTESTTDHSNSKSDSKTNSTTDSKLKSITNFITTSFLLSGLIQTLYILFKPRKDNSRAVLIILFLCTNLYQIGYACNEDITVLFVERRPLSWPESWNGYLFAVENASLGACQLFVLPLLSNAWKCSDEAILIMSIVSNVVRSVWTAFCTQTWMVVSSVVVGGMAGIVMSAVRSGVSKHVQDNEVGKMFSLVYSFEVLSRLLGSLLFANLYRATAHVFPGFSFLVQAFLCVVMFFMALWLYRLNCYHKSDGVTVALAEKTNYGTNRTDK